VNVSNPKINHGTIETGDTKYRLSQMLFDKMPQGMPKSFCVHP